MTSMPGLPTMNLKRNLERTEAGAPFLPFLSVIVPIYNGEDDLPNLLAGLSAQTYPADQVEYLLVDNGSCDRTPQLLADAAQSFAAQGLNLKPLNESTIQSAYAARNTGILAAKGEFLVFTDADCRPQPDWLIQLVAPFQNPSVGLVAGGIDALPGHTLLERYAERKELLSQRHTIEHSYCPYGQTANLAIRASALETVGLFRPYLTTGGDADMCWRILKSESAVEESNSPTWQIKYVEAASVQHHHRQTLEELRKQWQRYGRSNRYLHELHGIALAKSLPQKERTRCWLRWAFKELPIATAKTILDKGTLVDMVLTPLDLFCARARDNGQSSAQLPANARPFPPYVSQSAATLPTVSAS